MDNRTEREQEFDIEAEAARNSSPNEMSRSEAISTPNPVAQPTKFAQANDINDLEEISDKEYADRERDEQPTKQLRELNNERHPRMP